MSLVETLNELVIFARERGGDDEPEVRQFLSHAERELVRIQLRRDRRAFRQRQRACIRCQVRRTADMLCAPCVADCPPAIRLSFHYAAGLDGMRAAVATLKAWATYEADERSAA